MIDFDQSEILDKLATYLKQENRDPAVISDLENGHCAGFSVLWMYSKWLGAQPKTADLPQDDDQWFRSCFSLIDSWEPTEPLTQGQKASIDRFLSLLVFYQHLDRYLPLSQDDFQQAIQDSAGTMVKKEFMITNYFTLDQLKNLLPQIIKEGKPIAIGSEKHVTALLKIKGDIYFYDANASAGEVKVASIDELAEMIFKAHDFTQHDQLSPLTFKVVGIGAGAPASYPQASTLLSQYFKTDSHPNVDKNYNPLIFASKNGDVESVKFFLSKQFDVNAKDSKQFTALNRAAQNSYVDVAKLLITNKADLESKDDDGETPLMFAADKGNIDMIELLVKEGANIHQTDEDGMTALMYAAEDGKLSAVEKLIEKGADIHARDNEQMTALMHAAEDGHLDTVRMLLEQPGIDINVKNKGGRTALSFAAENGHTSVVALFLANNANVNIANKKGRTPLMYAARHGHPEITKQLLKHNPPEEQIDKAFKYAYVKGHLDVIRVLSPNDSDSTIMTTAIKKRHKNTIVNLIKNGININAVDQEGSLPLTIALDAKKGRTKIIKNLLRAGADINCLDKKRRSPLSHAIEKKQVDIVDLMLGRMGDDFKILMYAAKNNNVALAKLFSKDIDNIIDQANDEGRTLLMVAAQNNADDFVKFLLEHEPDLNAKDLQGRAAIEIAARYGHVDVVKTLIEPPLEKCADQQQQEIAWQTLSVAMKYGKSKVVEQLLSNDSFKSTLSQHRLKLTLFAIEYMNPSLIKRCLTERGSPSTTFKPEPHKKIDGPSTTEKGKTSTTGKDEPSTTEKKDTTTSPKPGSK